MSLFSPPISFYFLYSSSPFLLCMVLLSPFLFFIFLIFIFFRKISLKNKIYFTDFFKFFYKS
nr:MAG TPA: hypothetical protein [Caudoviricetes sp.]